MNTPATTDSPLPAICSGSELLDSHKQQCTLCAIELLVGGPYRDHPYGHVALRVITESSDTIYDYGRYGSVWGTGDSEGDGMLRVWTNFDKYIKGERATGRTTVGYRFDVPCEQTKSVNQFFSNKIKGIDPNHDRGYMKQYKLKEDYHALTSNCTTLSVDGAKQAIPNIDQNSEKFNIGRGLGMKEKLAASFKGWPQRIFMPQDLGEFLKTVKIGNGPQKTTY